MANSIVNNKEFRALLTRRQGATGRELADFTGRTFVYSAWSLWCMETEDRKLWTQKEGRETRYFLLTAAQAARENAKTARTDAKTPSRPEKAANANVAPPQTAVAARTKKPSRKTAPQSEPVAAETENA